MFQLVTTVKRGSASSFQQAWSRYPSIEAARTAATALLREDRVQRVMIVRNGLLPSFVEWCER
jgi:hypothetical protein